MVILIDSREQQPYKFRDVETTVGTLKTGDYTIVGYEDVICVERKATVAELAKNITEDRFWREMDRLTFFSHRFLLCEFSLNAVLEYPVGSDIPRKRWRYIKVRPAFILSKLADIEIRLGIPVIFAGSRANAKIFLNALFKRCILLK